MVSSFTNSILDILIPKYCVGCKKLNCFICDECYEKIEFFSSPIPVKIDPCYLNELWVMGKYSSPLSDLIKTYKYKKVKNIGEFLAKMMYYTMSVPYQKYLDKNQIIITSVPLHTKKLKERGFNQTELIAKPFSNLVFNSSLYKETLIRTKYSAPQASISDREARFSRLNNTFDIHPEFIKDDVSKTTILLIDDVTTTGTTLNECAKVLKKNGAKKVIGITAIHGG